MEGLLRQVDGYCERTDFSYWAEPINAVTNLAFIIAALVMARRVQGMGMPLALALCAILFAIGTGSYLFHTHATIWGMLADVVPIGLFILLYLYVVHREFVGMGRWVALGATALFIPYAAIITPLLSALPFLSISNFYWSVPLLLFIYGFGLRNRLPETARGMFLGGLLLCLSITVRSIDEMLCTALPMGTHWLWHCLNGLMLGWMIEVYRRDRLARAQTLA